MSTMGVKTGVKTWNDRPADVIAKGSGLNTTTEQDLKSLGADNIGEVLNKVADPNWTDPSKKLRAVGSDKLDKDAFMKMMLAQMKNQDPTNPMKSHEMAAQLAQFSTVEQMSNMNSTLLDIKNGQKPAESFQALQFIGKGVQGDSSKVFRAKGDTDHDFSYVLPTDAKTVEIKVRNDKGDVLRKINLPTQKVGDNKWVWNGLDDKGNAAPAGEYQILIEAKDNRDMKINVKTDFEGTISGVNYTPEGPVLLVGNQSVRLKDVKKIVDPSLKSNDQIMNNNQNSDLKAPAQLDQTKKRAGDAEFVSKSANLDNLNMSQEMMNKIAKEIKPDAVKN